MLLTTTTYTQAPSIAIQTETFADNGFATSINGTGASTSFNIPPEACMNASYDMHVVELK